MDIIFLYLKNNSGLLLNTDIYNNLLIFIIIYILLIKGIKKYIYKYINKKCFTQMLKEDNRKI